MKVTAELPDDLVKQIKLRAVEEGVKLKDMFELVLRRGLATSKQRVKPVRKAVIKNDPITGLPTIQSPDDAPICRMTSREFVEHINQILEEEDLARAGLPLRR